MNNPFTYKTRACPMARAVTGHRDQRCGQCPFKDCILGNQRLKKQYLLEYIPNLLEAFSVTGDFTIGQVITLLKEE